MINPAQSLDGTWVDTSGGADGAHDSVAADYHYG